MARKTVIELSSEERQELECFAKKGKHPARQMRRAQIILALDRSESCSPSTAEQAAAAYGVSRQTVYVVARDYAALGIDGVIERKKRESPPVTPKCDGAFEARLIALCSTDPPEGYARWTVRLLADKTVELGYIDSIAPMTISRVLKKTNLSLT